MSSLPGFLHGRHVGPAAAVVVFALICVALIAQSPARRVGDSAEYVAMTDQLSRLHQPALAEGDIDRIEAWYRSLGTNYETGWLRFDMLEADGRQDLPHFWFYSALVVPAYWMTRATGLHPNFAFAVANLLLLVGGFVAVRWRLGVLPAALLLLGLIVWWIDKPHTEVFTFSLLATALALLDRWPGWSLALIGAAATQNPAIALALPIVAAAAVIADPSVLRARTAWIGAGVGAAVAALHPLYYLARLGEITPQALTGGVGFHVPSRPELGAFIWDPNLGLLWGFPLLLPLTVMALALAAARLGRRTLSPGVLAVLPLAALFAVSFAQTANFNAGATFGMGRYALWLIPLAVPVFERWHAAGRPWAPGLAVAVVASVSLSIAVAHPRHADHYDGGPSYAARVLWDHFPTLDNPLVEVFSERLRHAQPGIVPVATQSCDKVLLVEGVAPPECPVPDPPDQCRHAEALCYANRTGDTYRFDSVPQGRA